MDTSAKMQRLEADEKTSRSCLPHALTRASGTIYIYISSSSRTMISQVVVGTTAAVISVHISFSAIITTIATGVSPCANPRREKV